MSARYKAVIILFLAISYYSFSQVTGRVTDKETGKPVPGAAIAFKENGSGTACDHDGVFRTAHTGTVTISAVGYQAKIAELTDTGDTLLFTLEPDKYELDEVVVEAFNRSRRLVDVPGSITLIQGARIERENPVTVVPVINHAPGVFAHSGALNTSRITIRGIGARVPYATGKVRAYLNNIPLTNGSGISIIEDIDPSLIERAEIIKGPATSVYGAGLGGTVILRAKDPALLPSGISNSFHAGSWDLYRNSLGFNTGNEQYGISLQYNHTQSSGYRQNNEYRRDGLSILGRAMPDKGPDITFLLVYTGLKAQIPSSIDSTTFVTDPSAAAQNWLRTRGYEDYDKLLAGVSADYRIAGSLNAGFSLFSTLYDENELRPFDVLYEERASVGSRFKLVYDGRLSAGSWQVLGGGELFLEQYGYRSYENIGGVGEKGGLISDNRELISYYNAFAQADIDLHRLRLSSGLNINSSKTDYSDLFNQAHDNQSGKYSYGNIVSPRISANYRYFMSNSVFLTVSHGFSPPSLAETLTPEGYVNPGIKPERSWSIEGGIRGNLMNHRFFYDINIYSMRVSDLLVAERVAEDAWVGKNAGESLHRGLEAELQLDIVRREEGAAAGWWQPVRLTVSPNLTVNNFIFTDFIDDRIDYSGNYLPGIPGTVINAGFYGALNGGLYALVNLRSVGTMPMNDLNSLWSQSYFLAGATAGYRHRFPFNLRGEAWISSGNIFNRSYASMILVNAPVFNNRPPRYYYPGDPRNFSAGVKISYVFN